MTEQNAETPGVRICPEDGAECVYTYDGTHDPRWVCVNDDCDFWGLA